MAQTCSPADLDRGYCYEPTVLGAVDQDMDIMHAEVFGPVSPILVVEGFDEAIAYANDARYGLSSYVFTDDDEVAMRAPPEIGFGQTYINRTLGAALQGFHTGWDESGMGGEDGKYGVLKDTRVKTVYQTGDRRRYPGPIRLCSRRPPVARKRTEAPMRIAVDMENVLADPKTWFLEVYNDRNGSSYRVEDVTHWDWVQTEIEFAEFMETIQEGWRHHAHEIEPLEDDLSTVFERLARLPDAEVDIVTARTGVEEEMQDWLAAHGVSEYDAFLSIDPFETKATLGYEYYIDDNPRLVADLEPAQTQYLVTWPWNRSARGHPRAIPVESVSDAAAAISEERARFDR